MSINVIQRYLLFLTCVAVRNAMEIDIRQHIIILDEAHNVEDVSRDSGSIEVTEEDLESKLSTSYYKGWFLRFIW